MLSPDTKLLAVYDKLDKKLNRIQLTQGEQGPKGDKGDSGKDGLRGEQGKAGVAGKTGPKGTQGEKGKEGEKGTSITDVRVDFDNHLVVSLSDGSELDAGEINVSSLDATQGSVNVSMGGAITAPLPTVTLVTTNYTTVVAPLEEIVKCTNNTPITVTLHPSPTQGQRRTIKRLGIGAVIIAGTVDGETTTDLGVDVSVQLIYIDDSWIII